MTKPNSQDLSVRCIQTKKRKLFKPDIGRFGDFKAEKIDRMLEAALKLAKLIAEKSPVAVQGTKTSLIYARDNSVEDGLEQIVSWINRFMTCQYLVKFVLGSLLGTMEYDHVTKQGPYDFSHGHDD